MARTTSAEVAKIIDTDATLDLRPFIDTANALVDWLNTTCDSLNALSASDLELIERWLSAHFYAHRDQLYTEKSTGKSSGRFQGQTAMALSSTQYGQTAMALDITGCLARRSADANEGGRRRVGVQWLGKAAT